MRLGLLLVCLVSLLVGCGSPDPGTAGPVTATPSAASPSGTPATVRPSPTPSPHPSVPPLGSVPPGWLGTRVLKQTEDGFGEQLPTPPELRNRRFTLPDTLPPLPGSGFASRITDPAPSSVISRSTWAPGCPVTADQLAWVRLTFWGFDHRRHTGELLVNSTVAADLVSVFRTLYDERFPIEQMRITTKAEQTAPPTGDGNDTGSFNCRPVRGQQVFSQHAYGLAVDLNPFQNPYVKGTLVLPELAGSYVDRDRLRAGMISGPQGVVVAAFARIGWAWGGSWNSLKDYQHFSQNGG